MPCLARDDAVEAPVRRVPFLEARDFDFRSVGPRELRHPGIRFHSENRTSSRLELTRFDTRTRAYVQ